MQNKIIVNKFGGGIFNVEFILLIKQQIKEQIKKGYQPIVVVSALNGTTDELAGLLSIAKKKQ